ncbi:MAG: hypothetical protein JWQ09_1797 [Segetibacter sp.]|nr:hypothetical protein [Segetibacter sp.]
MLPNGLKAPILFPCFSADFTNICPNSLILKHPNQGTNDNGFILARFECLKLNTNIRQIVITVTNICRIFIEIIFYG